MRMYRVIYDAINEVEAAMKGMLAPKFREVDLGRAEVRKCVPHHRSGHGGRLLCHGRQNAARCPDAPAAGQYRHLRRRHRLPPALQGQREGVAQGYECGITFEKFQDIKEGDVIEAYLMEQIEV